VKSECVNFPRSCCIPLSSRRDGGQVFVASAKVPGWHDVMSILITDTWFRLNSKKIKRTNSSSRGINRLKLLSPPTPPSLQYVVPGQVQQLNQACSLTLSRQEYDRNTTGTTPGLDRMCHRRLYFNKVISCGHVLFKEEKMVDCQEPDCANSSAHAHPKGCKYPGCRRYYGNPERIVQDVRSSFYFGQVPFFVNALQITLPTGACTTCRHKK